MGPCKSILIVEDDESIRETLRLMLELENYNVTTAANGRDGLDSLPSMPRPCLILLDLMMPIMNGWEFMEAVNQDVTLATIPIVIVTAFSEKAAGIKAQGLLKKPIDMDLLLRAVHQYCGPAEG